ncbi:MAG: NfeD family protein [Prevotella sp.]|jgi:membrane protein implicated in regulation of membrane protease activity|nr:NfeD family protein [Prevotella sp.]MBQ4147372.1 NfeD family protein [Prevotella sp.]MBQ4445864.1 NfeD family protein [Prevotella sp.]MBQ6032412.1 NfeD family protein [Prevotella sp.]MBQ9569927.1 NfeD family protein [Prevotella sp.]
MIEYFASNMWQMWVIIAVICLILELMNGDFFIMCFAIGGVCSSIAAAVGGNIYVQLAVFAITSVLSLFFVRPAALRYLHKNEDSRVSNADALIGQTGRVSEPIVADGFGRVAIDGDDWKALSIDGQPIEKDARVRVVSRESIIITVERV